MTQRLPVLKPKDVLRALEREGFFVHHATGSHYILEHPQKPNVRITLPFHNKDLKRRTLASIIEQAGYTPEEFIKMI
ncbi:MAG TPA: type II toxin-antitoxin system HicA family toxin [Blastocatellia bacterium]